MLRMPIGNTILYKLRRRLLVFKGHSTWFGYLWISSTFAIDWRRKQLLLAHKSFFIVRQGLLSLRSDLSCCGIIFISRYGCVTTNKGGLLKLFDVTIRADISASNVISVVNHVDICWSSDWLCRRALVSLSWSHDGLWWGCIRGLIHWIFLAFTILALWSVNFKRIVQ